MDFEQFLRKWHAKGYLGTDDDMPDDFDAWISEIDKEFLINLGNIACRESEMRGMEKMTTRATKIIRGEL